MLPARQIIEVVATISDDTSVTSAELVWEFSGQTYPCPHSSENVQCTKSSTQYTWSLDVGEGSRSFTVQATDAAGHRTQTSTRTIELVAGATPAPDDDHEDDDTLATAGTVRCGDSLSLLATDADWFRLEVEQGQSVSASAGGNEIIATAGPLSSDEITRANGSISFLAPSQVFLAVLPAQADAGAYVLAVTCTDAPADPNDPNDPNDPTDPGELNPDGDDSPGSPIRRSVIKMQPGCSASHGVVDAPAALLAGLALLRLRRRQR